MRWVEAFSLENLEESYSIDSWYRVNVSRYFKFDGHLVFIA
ncbi:hypothetical protein ALP99_101661 [Pseudomonas syringae pv. tomato]|uniref:Uncharacterized protein n=3 Tax=Pseudomonas syringae group genomosp. 3 TaxID=251701 RepID=Q881M0_PSESM|nr:hypothetical protein PSPTO_2869 [Pseudomonas syringae pv. tomato str. DC3000]AVI87743.1 hypothetical protein XJ28_14915 [Pseudomonas syringae pv. tomato]KPW50341.1 hypothetical protein ALO86_101384 [Pseudomonas syringae pv. berberidis]KPX74323.1 hypothetical protein ALO84_101449 [Pseudomonas syringae pv. maculicola]KPY26120.1 hypothetical protein ALO54_05015 [Pseudomonas syringae pv. philadelphi]MCF5245336.1 hypothetical protein [Pseudomonas syringae]POQ06653.1 hypothetical protein CXB40_1